MAPRSPLDRWASWRQEVTEDLGRWGLRRALFKQLMMLLRVLIGLRLFRIHVREHYRDVAIPDLPPGYSMRLLSRDDLKTASANPELDLVEAYYLPSLARGDLCVGAYFGDELVSYVWRAFVPTPAEDDFWFEFHPPLRYGYKAYTLPSHRGKHLQHPIALLTEELCLERGFTHALSYIEVFNYASIISDQRRNNRLHGYAGYVGFGRFRMPFRSPGAKRQRVRFYKP